MFFELPLFGLATWLLGVGDTNMSWRRAAAFGIMFLIGLEALAFATWSLYLQTHDNRGDIPLCGKRSGRKFFFDDCGRSSRKTTVVSIYIWDGSRMLMMFVSPIPRPPWIGLTVTPS
jgi:hypothetical protein